MAINRKIYSISLPPKMGKELNKMAKDEEKSKSEIVREALRLFFRQNNKKRR